MRRLRLPAGASHFTIDYVYNGGAGTMDGWLNDDDSVTLAPRVARQTPGAVWWSPGGAPVAAWVDWPGGGGTYDVASEPIAPHTLVRAKRISVPGPGPGGVQGVSGARGTGRPATTVPAAR